MPRLSLFGVPYGVTAGSPRGVVGEPDHHLAVTPLREMTYINVLLSLHVPK